LVEPTFSWFGRNRCLAKGFENLAVTLARFVTLASILRRLAQAGREVNKPRLAMHDDEGRQIGW
jgi:hypothetical protein